MKLGRMGHTFVYFPFGPMIETPQIAAFHKKLSDGQLIEQPLSSSELLDYK